MSVGDSIAIILVGLVLTVVCIIGGVTGEHAMIYGLIGSNLSATIAVLSKVKGGD
jgi:hypothetical protein